MLIALIPAYNPFDALPDYIRQLQQRHVFAHVIVVNDGSKVECEPIFKKIETQDGVTVLRHVTNQGKGAGLKTGLNYIAYTFKEALGVVTIDADGQHRVEDACHVGMQLTESSKALIVGGRTFKREIPLRSFLGNFFTRHFFRLITGLDLFDTQSGLRGIPLAMISDLLLLEANGYEFELDMLMHATQWGFPIIEVPIETIYLNDNQHSSFRPLWDSLRIYFVLLRFSIIAILSALVDYGLFVLVYYLIYPNVMVALISGRVFSITFNYLNVRRYAFRAKKLSHWRTLPQYLTLAGFSAFMAWLLITGFIDKLHWHVVSAKIMAEVIMFVVNFLIQRDFIFRRRA